VALLGFAVVTSLSTPPSALHTALQDDFPLQAEFDSFGERVEGLALELARGLVLAKEETAETDEARPRRARRPDRRTGRAHRRARQ
jgi:hypothetical protein